MRECQGFTPERVTKARGKNPAPSGGEALPTGVPTPSSGGAPRATESERMRWDPKGGDLSVRAAKPGEIPVEVRRRY